MTSSIALDEIGKTVLSGLELGLRKRIAHLFDVTCSPSADADADAFAKNVERTVEIYKQCVFACVEILADKD